MLGKDDKMNSLDFNITKEGLEKEVGNLDDFADKFIENIAKMIKRDRANQKYYYDKWSNDPYTALLSFDDTKKDVFIVELKKDKSYRVYDEIDEGFNIIVDSKREAIKQAIKYGVNKNGNND
jgi:hypothetical protein